jgi:hypothetical protein
METMIYPFVKEPKNLDLMKDSQAYILHAAMERTSGNIKELTEEEKKLIHSVFSELWHVDAYRTGRYKLGGWIFDFSPWMKTYWVKVKYYGITEINAFNKTMIRQNAVTPSHILQIVELADKRKEQ